MFEYTVFGWNVNTGVRMVIVCHCKTTVGARLAMLNRIRHGFDTKAGDIIRVVAKLGNCADADFDEVMRYSWGMCEYCA